MLSLIKQENAKPVCIIKNKDDKKVKEIFLYEKKKNVVDGFSEMELENEFQFQQIPNQDKERDVLYVAGASGSGKSHYIKQFVKQYIKMYPKRDLFLFSFLNEDKTLDEIKKIQRIDIYNPEFLSSDIKSEDFKDSLVILDDCDAIPERKVKAKVMNLVNQMLQLGRHDNITICWACHEVCNAHETKVILSESHSLTIFPLVMGNAKLFYLLHNYYGMDKAQIEKFKNVAEDTRAITVFRTYPKIVMSERKIYIL
jgi:hypothetical protein